MNQLKILTDGWGETLVKPLESSFSTLKVFGLTKDYGYKYNDYTAHRFIASELKKHKYDFVHLNCWFDIFRLPKCPGVRIIFESHGIHPGISLRYSIQVTESLLNKCLIVLFYPFFRYLFLRNSKLLDRHYVSIPGILDFINTAKWLPNPVDTSIFHKVNEVFSLDNSYVNIFYPTSLRDIKNPGFALALMGKIVCKYPNARLYFIRQSVSNFAKYESRLKDLEKNIIWIDQIKREELPKYYSADWDLVLGSFFPTKPYAVLNMVELEAMACMAPIIACDLFEIILKPIHELENLAFELIENSSLRKKYIQTNFEYVMRTHAMERVAELYKADILTLASYKD